MHLEHLSLHNFRNYARLALDLPDGVSLFTGANGQGKSNLLEAIYYLATTRSYRAGGDRELVNWLARGEELPFARLAARVRRREEAVQMDITLLGQPASPGEDIEREDESHPNHVSWLQAPSSSLQKKIRVNGVPKRAIDAIGHVNVVMFGPQDLDLVSGAPALRRRYLDATLCQTSHRYVRSLQRYNRVVTQRNHLLRRIGEGRAQADELEYWDKEMTGAGSYIVEQRQQALSLLGGMAQSINEQLTAGRDHLRIAYRTTLDVDGDVAAHFAGRLKERRARDIQAGMSLSGPHRDDLAFLVDGVDMRVYGSRGQQRTVALALKFAEARYMCGVVGEEPILLLDDVMSELDGDRRQWVLRAVEGGGQALITATDTRDYGSDFLLGAHLWRVEQGLVDAISAVEAV